VTEGSSDESGLATLGKTVESRKLQKGLSAHAAAAALIKGCERKRLE